jgi:hypothetical protein
MSQVYRTLRVAPSDEGVLRVVIDAPPTVPSVAAGQGDEQCIPWRDPGVPGAGSEFKTPSRNG